MVRARARVLRDDDGDDAARERARDGVT